MSNMISSHQRHSRHREHLSIGLRKVVSVLRGPGDCARHDAGCLLLCTTTVSATCWRHPTWYRKLIYERSSAHRCWNTRVSTSIPLTVHMTPLQTNHIASCVATHSRTLTLLPHFPYLFPIPFSLASSYRFLCPNFSLSFPRSLSVFFLSDRVVICDWRTYELNLERLMAWT